MRVPLVVLATLSLACAAYGGDGRIRISQADIETAPFTYVITNSGSYVLTENLSVGAPDMDGISVQANDVTLDLNGFAVRCVAGSSGTGIIQSNGWSGLCVKNGMVSGWNEVGAAGILALGDGNRIENVIASGNRDGIRIGDGGVVIGCTADSNEQNGIIPGGGSVVRDCAAQNNGNGGISAGRGCVVVGCTAVSNGSGLAVSADSGSVIARCRAAFSVDDGIHCSYGSVVAECTAFTNAYNGIEVGGGSVIRACSLAGNGWASIMGGSDSLVSECSVRMTRSTGISVLNGSAVRGCTVSDGRFSGIQGNRDNRIEGNDCDGNANEGVQVGYPGNFIAENNATRGRIGIECLVDGNAVVRNSAGLNSLTNYFMSGGNVVGPIRREATNSYECTNFEL
jgi:hypothetical protein